MFRFNREKFFAGARTVLGALSQPQVDGLSEILDHAEADPLTDSLNQLAYMIATIQHETNVSGFHPKYCKPGQKVSLQFHPIVEKGSDSYFFRMYDIRSPLANRRRVARRLGNLQPGDGVKFRGRGYPQTTGRANYAKATKRVREITGDQVDFVANPDDLLKPEYAWLVMSVMMHEGLYTGKSLDDYITETDTGEPDYYNARRIINALDQAERIAGYARGWASVLRDSLIEETSAAEAEPVGEAEYEVIEQTAEPAKEERSDASPSKLIQIASTGTTNLAKAATAGSIPLAGLLTWLQANWILIAIVLIAATLIFLTIYIFKHLEKLQAARINADPGLHDVEFKRRT